MRIHHELPEPWAATGLPLYVVQPDHERVMPRPGERPES